MAPNYEELVEATLTDVDTQTAISQHRSASAYKLGKRRTS